MPRPKKSEPHVGPQFDGLPHEWVFAPWRRPHWRGGRCCDTEDKLVTRRNVLTGSETEEEAFKKDRAERHRLFSLIPIRANDPAACCQAYRRFLACGRTSSWYYQLDLEKRLRPKENAVRERLADFSKQAALLLEAYGRLDDWERVWLLRRAGEEPREGRIWALHEPVHSLADHSYSRLGTALAMVEALRRWSAEAAEEADAEVEKGRPRHDAERKAVRILADLWRELVGEEFRLASRQKRDASGRRRGQEHYARFLDLCRGVLQPVAIAMGEVDKRGRPPDLTTAVKEVAAERKTR